MGRVLGSRFLVESVLATQNPDAQETLQLKRKCRVCLLVDLDKETPPEKRIGTQSRPQTDIPPKGLHTMSKKSEPNSPDPPTQESHPEWGNGLTDAQRKFADVVGHLLAKRWLEEQRRQQRPDGRTSLPPS
jgi:hypothetical protein